MLTDRQMKRERYYAIRRYLRQLSTVIHNTIDYDKLKDKYKELMIKGQTTINTQELLKL